MEGRFPIEPETTAFRVVQEALTNVARHSGATRSQGRHQRGRGARSRVVVSDHGRGFDTAVVLPTLVGGLAGLRERVGLLGGQVQIVSSGTPERGSKPRIPVPSAKSAGASGPGPKVAAGLP